MMMLSCYQIFFPENFTQWKTRMSWLQDLPGAGGEAEGASLGRG
jgi:hypothetical protein